MNNNWKSLVEKQNAKSFVLPPGWDSRDDIAEQLECSVDRVRLLLAPGLKTGVIESGIFPVWDGTTKRVNRVTAYRRIDPVAAGKKPAK
jgi:hypothetical protein